MKVSIKWQTIQKAVAAVCIAVFAISAFAPIHHAMAMKKGPVHEFQALNCVEHCLEVAQSMRDAVHFQEPELSQKKAIVSTRVQKLYLINWKQVDSKKEQKRYRNHKTHLKTQQRE